MASLDHTIYNALRGRPADEIMASGNALKSQKQTIKQNEQVIKTNEKELENYDQNRKIALSKEKYDYFNRALPMVVDQVSYDSMLDEVDELFPDADRSKMPEQYTDELGKKLRMQFGVKTDSPYTFLNTDEGVVRGNKQTGEYGYVSPTGGGARGGAGSFPADTNPISSVNLPDSYDPTRNVKSNNLKRKLKEEAYKNGASEIENMKKEISVSAGRAQVAQEFLAAQETQNPNQFLQMLLPDWLASFDPELGEMDAKTSYMTPRMREPGSGSSSDFEQTMYRRATFDRKKHPETNRAIASAYISQAKRDGERVQFFEQYLAENGHLGGAQKTWNAYMEDQPIFLPTGMHNDARMNFQEWVNDSGVNPYRPQTMEGRKKYLPLVNKKGWKLMRDKQTGAQAYVSETGDYEVVQ